MLQYLLSAANPRFIKVTADVAAELRRPLL